MAAKKKPKAKEKRRRRTAEEARDEILDAAERLLREGGPEAIRLQEVAALVGISHPAVLHHFGSREGLLAAVIERTMSTLERELFEIMVRGTATGAPPDGVEMTERVAEAMGEKGHARLIAWLTLSGNHPMRSESAREGWKMIIDATHALRVTRTRGRAKPTYEDTTFTVALSSITLFGEALIGAGALDLAGLGGDPSIRKRFRVWFAKLLEHHLEHPFDDP